MGRATGWITRRASGPTSSPSPRGVEERPKTDADHDPDDHPHEHSGCVGRDVTEVAAPEKDRSDTASDAEDDALEVGAESGHSFHGRHRRPSDGADASGGRPFTWEDVGGGRDAEPLLLERVVEHAEGEVRLRGGEPLIGRFLLDRGVGGVHGGMALALSVLPTHPGCPSRSAPGSTEVAVDRAATWLTPLAV